MRQQGKVAVLVAERLIRKKILPIILVVGGAIGFIYIMQSSGGLGGMFGG